MKLNAWKAVSSFLCLVLLALPSTAWEDWVPLGPDLINNGQSSSGDRTQVTGRINVVAPNPENLWETSGVAPPPAASGTVLSIRATSGIR